MFTKGFPQDRLITYSGMLWLLAAQIVVMLPLVFYLPIWLLPILLFSAGWRIRAMKGHTEQPGNIIKLIISLMGLAALAMSGMKIVSLDMMASLLMLGFAYKALEVIQRRDAMVVILTGYLLIGVLFLYSQSILTTLYGMLEITILTGAMIAIQAPVRQAQSQKILPNLKLAALMLLMCLPLMLMFFLFAPRFAPLWNVPLAGGHAKTGITDRMTPGDIANLSQSDELAFTVKFNGERPPQSELYWRGIVLQYFDGKTWTQFADDLDTALLKKKLKSNSEDILKRLVIKEPVYQYETIYERSAQPWLFSLSPVVELEGNAFLGSDFRIMANQDVIEPMMLKLSSYPQSLRDVELDSSTYQQTLQLPEAGNIKSRVLAKRLLSRSSSVQEYIQTVLKRYTQQNFYYTLKPPTLGEIDTIDRFLFESKKGFCAHYAGSFVFMMRAAGIPARVITGYQGGEWNKNGKFIAVHQYDAHAWTEVWLKNQGWIRIDPTTMVAPERIEQGLEVAMKNEGSFLQEQMFSLKKLKWLNSLRQKISSTQYAWRRFVLGYNHETQTQFLKQLFGELSIQKIILISGAIFSGIILIWVILLGLTKKREQEAIQHQYYRRFCKQLAKKGIARDVSQSPEKYSLLASKKLPELANEIHHFTQVYSTLCYDPGAESKHGELIKKLRTILKKIN